jgi:hypothetical protein
MPLHPFKMMRAKERAPTPYSYIVFCLGFIFESFKELGVRHIHCYFYGDEKKCVECYLFHGCIMLRLFMSWVTI